MPQTVEAIGTRRAAGSADRRDQQVRLPDANRSSAAGLMEHGLVPEDFAARRLRERVRIKGTGWITARDGLLSDVLELRAIPRRRAGASCWKRNSTRGASVALMQDGASATRSWSHRYDACGMETTAASGRLGRASAPVRMIGLSRCPSRSGAARVESERDAREVAEQHGLRDAGADPGAASSRSRNFRRSDDEGPKELRIVLKADVHGSCEACATR